MHYFDYWRYRYGNEIIIVFLQLYNVPFLYLSFWDCFLIVSKLDREEILYKERRTINSPQWDLFSWASDWTSRRNSKKNNANNRKRLVASFWYVTDTSTVHFRNLRSAQTGSATSIVNPNYARTKILIITGHGRAMCATICQLQWRNVSWVLICGVHHLLIALHRSFVRGVSNVLHLWSVKRNYNFHKNYENLTYT